MNDEIARIFQELRARKAFREVQRFANAADFGSTTSWDGLEENARAAIADDHHGFTLDALGAFFESCAVNGSSAVRFYSASEELAEKSALAEVVDSPISVVYPFPIAIDDDAAQALSAPRLVSRTESDDRLELVFGSVRATTHRERLDPDLLSEDAPEYLREAEIFYNVTEWFQAYDLISIPAEGPIVVRVDRGNDLSKSEQDAAFQALLNSWFEMFDAPPPLGGALNLFPAIDSIYRDGDEGRVVALHFNCATQVSRHERVRLTSDRDLREEEYHVAGTDEVAIEPFRVDVAWKIEENDDNDNVDNDNDREVLASLQGTLSDLLGGRFLDRAVFPKFQDADELLFMVSRILTHAGHV